MTKNYKRPSGQQTEKKEWLVLTESEEEENGDYTHKCGTCVLAASVTLSNRDGVGPFAGNGKVTRKTVPFCPECEREPTKGTFNRNGITIDS